MILYNIVQLLTTYVAEVKQCPPERISLEKFFDDLRDQLVAWNIVIGPEPTAVWFAECLPEEDLRERLRTMLAGTWSETWWKAKPQPNRTTTNASVNAVMAPCSASSRAMLKPKRKPKRQLSKKPRGKDVDSSGLATSATTRSLPYLRQAADWTAERSQTLAGGRSEASTAGYRLTNHLVCARCLGRVQFLVGPPHQLARRGGAVEWAFGHSRADGQMKYFFVEAKRHESPPVAESARPRGWHRSVRFQSGRGQTPPPP